MNNNDVVSQIINSSDSILLMFTALILISIFPIYRGISKIIAKNRSKEAEREDRLIKVIEKNTEAITKLESHIEFDKKTMDENFEKLNARLIEIEKTL